MVIAIGLAGAGAFGQQHLVALRDIDGCTVVAVAEPDRVTCEAARNEFLIPSSYASLEEMLGSSDIDAVILATPTPGHAAQAIAVLDAGKHVLVEIPLCDTASDAQRVLEAQEASGKICMVGHTRRFNPSHQWIKQQIDAEAFTLQAMVAETFFLRRSNINAQGQPRSWTDHLLWHHAAHTIDLFQFMTGAPVKQANILQGPKHPDLGIAMDMAIQLKSASGAVLNLTLSFNNDGPLGTHFRYIGDTGTYRAFYDELHDGWGNPINLLGLSGGTSGLALQDREFVEAIAHQREPSASVGAVAECYRLLGELARELEGQDGWS